MARAAPTVMKKLLRLWRCRQISSNPKRNAATWNPDRMAAKTRAFMTDIWMSSGLPPVFKTLVKVNGWPCLGISM